MEKGGVAKVTRAEFFYENFEATLLYNLSFSETSLEDLESTLLVMPAPEVQTLAKTLKLNTKNQQKEQLTEAIIKHSKQKHLSAFFKQAANTGNMVLNRYRSYMYLYET